MKRIKILLGSSDATMSGSTGIAVLYWALLFSRLVLEHGPLPVAIQNTVDSNDPQKIYSLFNKIGIHYVNHRCNIHS
jgi:hypothetical protein